MEKLKNFIRNNPFLALLFPTGVGGVNFFTNLFSIFGNCEIDPAQLQELTSSASGFQMILLVFILMCFKSKKGK